MTEHDDVRRMASDPATDWDILHWIAENHPELRPEVAANPSTYPELLEALADLDDPAINAALMRRFWPEDELPVTERAADPEPEPEPESEPDPEPDPEPDLQEAGILLPGDDQPQDSHTDPLHDDDPGVLAVGATPAADEDAPEAGERRRGRRVGFIVLAVLLPLIAVGAILALGLTLLGDRSTPAAEQSPAPEPEQTTTEPEESPEPSPEEPEIEGPTVEEARAALQDLPEETSCEDPAQDAEVFELLAERGDEEDAWTQEHADLSQDVVEDLQDECGDPYAARVFQLLSGEGAEHDALSTAVGGMGTDWFNYAFPATGAREMTTFSAPTGNVVCELGESLRCRVLDHSFEAPEGCEDGTTYRISVDEGPEPDCENQVSPEDEPEVLQYGQTAANGFFACASFPSQMSCWNQLTGEGINLSSTRNSIY
ncbi:hypothetical protein [Nesterenkonia xinjiangensis]|uniref:Leucine rich repeat variant domain-containing protein n=1 Tax=Nesterenkonia xinjiangensis TaxID=225327 RepID=A0A7Z0K9N6_9MICC|nr:hypothetical protein [Nesterenkonia xinjiangensis]NYJ78934.1 hypothetical protein [Nesterenkonia xinjiangensis]